jgi:hypothetical protein
MAVVNPLLDHLFVKPQVRERFVKVGARLPRVFA